ncbi:UNVERIFIED_CONTAM: hypothetical protein Scaly_1155300 [Sesamum calycinum]|uniref:hAT-like transposase RNase-H fold domain-containing protein n=1 Tax=Sesamum calycinum TaxID=2727403 RepID=A0AAW2Q2P9_9LAMI
MSNYGGIGSHSQSQSNSSPDAQIVKMDEFQNQDGLKGKDEHEVISCIRGAIRWNSTYLMLKTAIGLKITFDAYENLDLAYKIDLSRQPFDGIPTDYDWEMAKVLMKFLKHFYNLTLRISGAMCVTSNIVFREICEVDLLLKYWLSSNDVELIEMARKMKEKYLNPTDTRLVRYPIYSGSGSGSGSGSVSLPDMSGIQPE